MDHSSLGCSKRKMLMVGCVGSKRYQRTKLTVEAELCTWHFEQRKRLQSQNASSLFSNTFQHVLTFKHIKCICPNVKWVPKSQVDMEGVA